jgi:hypothetical protein
MTFSTAARTTLRLNQAEIDKMLRSPSGMVARDLVVRATRVQLAAQQQIRLGHVHAGPTNFRKGVGNLRTSVRKRLVPSSGRGGPSVIVGSDDPIAMIYHQGSKPHVIKPRRARVLVFWTGTGKVITHRVNHPGTQPNRYLTDNLKYAVI